ncbi:DUF6345 domain-containing protein [Archangium lipolyticum]|uniref:DUF6345 domain-containing protein n=1 Tax=Archangium lipolyticum TaxID=2970465 RepID=UPI00214A4CD7|nr:DUF6345 domain-containing protein [Archangium lipolyticum]
MNHIEKWRGLSLLCTTAALGLTACGPAESLDMQPEVEAAATGQVAQAVGRTFGTLCTEGYQNGWQKTLPQSYERCSWFNDELNDTDTQSFYYGLKGARPYIENSLDSSLVETVDHVFLNTHGGAWSDGAVYAMWDQNSLANTKNMRLGDESTGLSLLSTYACETLYHGDGKLISRWKNTFRGGLRFVTGSWSKLYDGITTNEVGEDYADELQSGSTIRSAWRYATSDWATDQDPSVMATGTGEADCVSRLKNMKWTNLTSYPRRVDGAVTWYCITYWSNL